MKARLKECLPILFFFSIVVAIGITVNAIGQNNYLAIFSFIYLCLCAWNHHRTKLDDSKNLYEKIAWIAERGWGDLPPTRLRDFELVEYIEFEQRNQNIQQKYRIDFSNEAEKEYLKQILNSHKEDVLKSFFYGRLTESKDIYNLDSLEYYFVSLNSFICNKYDNKVYSKREYISDYEYKEQLTEYGRVHYKLKLITQLYIENNARVQKLYNFIDKERKKNIIETLDKNEVCFFQYQP